MYVAGRGRVSRCTVWPTTRAPAVSASSASSSSEPSADQPSSLPWTRAATRNARSSGSAVGCSLRVISFDLRLQVYPACYNVCRQRTPWPGGPPMPLPASAAETAHRIFSPIASNYDRPAQLLGLLQYSRWHDLLLSRLTLSPGDRVLDMATGTGALAIRLAQLDGLRVTAA